jgi:Tol biopolymer transport system component
MRITGFSGGPGFSISANGTLAYATFKLQDARLAWVDTEGREVAKVPIDPAPYDDMKLSPDGRRVALVQRVSAFRSDIWIGDLERGVVTRFSQEPVSCALPHWSPDGTRIAYSISNQGPQSFVIRDVRSTSEAEVFLQSDPTYKNLSGWSPDGLSLLYSSQDPETKFDLWVLPLNGDREPQVYLKTSFMEFGGPVSPDGRWMAYTGNESGRSEGYVQPFPSPGVRYQVTKGGGFVARWLRDGKQLVFWQASSPTTLEIADVIPGEEFRLGPQRTFCVLPRGQISTRLADDGKRILSLLPAGEPAPNSLTVVLDWAAALGEK